jgi:hypothetical protein
LRRTINTVIISALRHRFLILIVATPSSRSSRYSTLFEWLFDPIYAAIK